MTESLKMAVIGAASSAGARRTGQERGPAALRRAGLIEHLQSIGVEIQDLGDIPTVCFRPDPQRPNQQNVDLVEQVARQVADLVDQALSMNCIPLVMGGDCSITLGVIAGILRKHARPGLVYFDGDADLNTPDTTNSGIFDGMVMAHLLGRGAPQLTGLGRRQPMLDEQDVVLFGYDDSSGWIEAVEIEIMENLAIPRYSKNQVKADPAAAAKQALAQLEDHCDAIVLHFDIDSMNVPVVDVHHPNGLEPGAAFEALKVFTAHPKLAGLVVTELNAELDQDGSYAALLADGLVDALGARLQSAA